MRKSRIIAALLAIAMAFSLSACTQKPWDADVVAFDPATFTNAQMLEDYDHMWKMLEDNCPLLGVIGRTRDIDIEKMKARGREDIEAIAPPIGDGWDTTTQFVSIMERSYGYFQSMGHIGPVNCLTYENNIANDAWESDTHKEIYSNDKSKAFYKYLLATPDMIKTKKTNEAKAKNTQNATNDNSETGTKSAQGKLIETYVQDGTPIIKLPTFYFGGDAQETAIKEIKEFCEDNANSENIIIDIRENTGGASDVWQQGFAPLAQGKKLELTNVGAFMDTPYNREVWGAWYIDKGQKLAKPIAEIANVHGIDLSMVNMQDLQGCDKMIEIISKPWSMEDDEILSHAKLWLLVDKKNFSAAEFLARYAKSSGFATLVGERTRGGGITMAPPAKIPFVLPNSGMICQYVPFYGLNADGTCNEEMGTPPDIAIADDEDALEVCLAEIAKGK